MKKFYLALLSLSTVLSADAQVALITPNNSGGFENGGSFGVNGWTAVNGANNQWAIGNGIVNFGTRSAYIGNATTYAGTNNAAINHFYRNPSTAVPVGATNVLLSFRYRQAVVDANADSFIVSVTPTATPAPVAGTTVSAAHTRIFQNTATPFPGFAQVGPLPITGFAGSNLRIVFTHVNNGAGAIGIPAVDSISLTYCPAITGTMTMCEGNSVTLTCADTGGVWTSSNTSIASIGANTMFTNVINGLAAGTATITHIGTAGQCTVTATVTVNGNPSTLSGSLLACLGSPSVLTSSPAGGGWATSNAAVATVTGGTVNPVSAGTANITYTLPTACRTISQVTVNNIPALHSVTGGGTFCASGSGVPVGLSNSNVGIDYTLYNGSTSVSTLAGTGSALSFGIISASGTYTVSATNPITTCSRAMSGSASVASTAPVTPSVTISSDAPATLCSGTAVNYTAIPVNEGITPAYDWHVNGTYVGAGLGYSYLPANGDVVRVVLHPGGICVAPDSAVDNTTMIVNPLATPGVTISVDPGNPSCYGRPVTFAATPSMGGTAPAYRWTKNGINVATGPTYTYTPAMGDMVHCMMTSNYLCRSSDTVLSSDITMTTVPSASLPVVSIAASPGTSVAPGTMVTLMASYTSGTSTVNYQWHVNGVAVPGATSDVYSSDTFVNGDIVTCKVINTDPCQNFTLKSIVINTTGTSGVSNINAGTNVAVMPNPSNGIITVIGAIESASAIIKVTNLMGQTVHTQNAQATNGSIQEILNLSYLSAGMYILNVNTANGSKSLHFTISD